MQCSAVQCIVMMNRVHPNNNAFTTIHTATTRDSSVSSVTDNTITLVNSNTTHTSKSSVITSNNNTIIGLEEGIKNVTARKKTIHNITKNSSNSNSRSLSPKKLAPNGGSSWQSRRNNKNKGSGNKNRQHHGKAKSTSVSPKVVRNYHHNNKQCCSPMTVLIKRVDLLDGRVAKEAAKKVEIHTVHANYEMVDHPHLISYSDNGSDNENTTDTCKYSNIISEPHKIPLSSLPGPVGKYIFQSPHEQQLKSENNIHQVSIMRVPLEKHAMNYWKNHFSSTSTAQNNNHRQQQHYHPYGGYVICSNSGVINNDKHQTEKKHIANPHPSSEVHDKYWAQRHRLFSRFDQGIQLDSEGWYSVTPEIIADNVAEKLGDLIPFTFPNHGHYTALPEGGTYNGNGDGGIVMLDAFCGMGGNSIAFAKIKEVDLVVCLDVDRSKLRMAAHNASLYNIPEHKLLFIESNSLFVMDQCYRDGKLILELNDNDDKESCNDIQPHRPVLNRRSSFITEHPPHREKYAGYTIGGLDLLPPAIDTIFMDPPWGGIDYEAAGKNGYDLKKNMKINYYANVGNAQSPPVVTADDAGGTNGIGIGDSNITNNTTNTNNLFKTVKEEYNKPLVVDGFSILKMAAAATKSKFVIYDLPRNTNKVSLGRAALAAGFQGNIQLAEHYLNGRLKTITAYLGIDFV